MFHKTPKPSNKENQPKDQSGQTTSQRKGHPSSLTGLLPSENQSQQLECHQSAPVKAVTAGLRLRVD